MNKNDDDGPTSKKRRSSSRQIDRKIIAKVESVTVGKKSPEPEGTNYDKGKEGDVILQRITVCQPMDEVKIVPLTQDEEKQVCMQSVAGNLHCRGTQWL